MATNTPIKIFLVMALSYILFVHNLGSIALWDPDEPRQAIMAREMMERKDYIRPYLNGEPYLEKPPLYPWLIIIASKIRGGLDEFSSRIPAAVSATLLLLITYYLGSMIGNPQAGLFSAVVLATNYQFLSNARESVMDMTFALFIGMSVLFGYMSINKNRKWYLALSFLPASFAILTKGPAGLVIPAFTIFFYLITQKRVKRFIIPLIAGCILSTAVSSIWFLLAGKEYIKEFILHQNITRYTNAFDHIESVYYYFKKLFVNFLPWSMLLPFAIYHACKRKYWLPFVWFTFTFLFFELSQSKRAIYLLSLYPACALLCGLFLQGRWSLMVRHPKSNIILICFAVLFGLLPIAASAILNTVSSPVIKYFREISIAVYTISGVLFAASAAFFYTVFKKKHAWALSILFFYLISIGYFYNAYYMPIMDRGFKSPRLITDQLGDLHKSRQVYTYGFSSAGIIFYVGKPIKKFINMNEIKDKKNDILLIIEDEQSAPIKKDLDALFVPVKKARYEREHYTFM